MKKIVTVLVLVSLSIGHAVAQPPPPPPPNTAISLDLIVSMLVMAGLLYGTFRLSQKKKQAVS